MDWTEGTQITLVESLRILKMAFPRYFQNNTFNARDGETSAMLALLKKGTIQCGCHKFPPAKNTAELQAQAERLAGVLRQSSYVRALRNALHVFSGYQFDLLRTTHGALYCPKLKLYVYVSYLTPKTLLGLLAQPDCEQVAVFIGLAKWGRRNHYLLFRRVGTGKAFNQTLQDLNPPARICKAGTTKCRKSEAQRADAKYTAMKNPEWQTQARRNAPCTALQ